MRLKILIALILIPLSLETYFHFKSKKKAHHHSEYSHGTQKFLDMMAKIESCSDERCISKTGYLGKYQFSLSTLRGMGYKMTADGFLNDKELQDSFMVAYMKYNENILHKYIQECSGYHIGDVKITKAGILAGSHTHGAGAVLNFLKSGGLSDTCDGNGVRVSQRINQFNNIQLEK